MEKYQITKTIRFKLEAVEGNVGKFTDEISKLGNREEAEASLHNLTSIGKELSSLLKHYIDYEDEKKNQKLKKSVTVHFRWLREFTKDSFFEWKNTEHFKKADVYTDKPVQTKSASGTMASQLKGFLPAHKRGEKKENKQESKNFNNKEKRFKLSDVKYLGEVFAEFFKIWDTSINDLSKEITKSKESLTRKAEIGKIVRLIGTRSYLPFFEKFIIESNDKDEMHLETQLKDRLETFKENLKKAELWTLPAQSSGIELAKASFNYYTINKKSNEDELKVEEIKIKARLEEYDAKVIQDIAQRENNLLRDLKIFEKYEQKNGQEKYHKFLFQSIEEENKKPYLKQTEEGETVNLRELYKIMKLYRAEQVALFNEAISKGVNYEDLVTKIPMFAPFKNTDENKNAFKKYNELTVQIQKIADQINIHKNNKEKVKELKNNKDKIAKTRGKLLFHTGLKTGQKDANGKEEILKFDRYKRFCEIYKDIAMKRGRLIARLKGIEKEKIDSQRLKYWSFLIEKENQHELVLIPKDKAQEAYRKISSFDEGNTDSTIVYYFESLPYRALRKLCFKLSGNTFQEGILKDPIIQKNWKEYIDKYFEKNSKKESEQRIGEYIFKNEKEERDEEKLVEFYKDVLRTEYVRKNREDGKIVLPPSFNKEVLERDFSKKALEQELSKKDISPEQEFKTALEKCCYLRKRVFPKSELNKILSDCDAQVFIITSYNLKGKGKKPKAHTKLWYQFWDDKNEKERFPLRLNPEIKILWREPKATRIDKYGKNSKLFDPNKKNRYLHPQYTLTTSFLENALHPEINYAFQDLNQKKDIIKEFNDKIKKEFQDKKQESVFYGIDTGESELATLCLIDANKNLLPFNVIEFKTEKLFYEKIGYLKDGTEKSYKAIQNLSYFLNEELYNRTFKDNKFQETFQELFTEKNTPAIDLTCAKLISGHIVLNGDISAKLNLSLSSARRKIVEALMTDASANWESTGFKISIGNETVFYGNEMYEPIKCWEVIEKELFEYYEKQKKNNDRTLEDINQYRKVIAANAVGILSYLYKKYTGIISIEFLKLSQKGSHTISIENSLEWGIIRKFQTEGLVPPVSEFIDLKEGEDKKEKPINKFGIIYFPSSQVKITIKNEKIPQTAKHSWRCPNCEADPYKDKTKDEKENDKKSDIFQCTICGYHNLNKPLGLQGLDSNDKVAAYNIAKRGLEILN